MAHIPHATRGPDKVETRASTRRPAAAAGFGRFRPSLPALVFALLTVPVMPRAITLTFQTVAGGVTLTGSGTPTAGLDFGNISKFGSLGSNITRNTTATDYTLSTDFGVRVTKPGDADTTSYTLQARLMTASAFNWSINSISMTTTLTNIATSLPYAFTFPYPLVLGVADSQTTGLSISQGFELLAIAD